MVWALMMSCIGVWTTAQRAVRHVMTEKGETFDLTDFEVYAQDQLEDSDEECLEPNVVGTWNQRLQSLNKGS